MVIALSMLRIEQAHAARLKIWGLVDCSEAFTSETYKLTVYKQCEKGTPMKEITSNRLPSK